VRQTKLAAWTLQLMRLPFGIDYVFVFLARLVGGTRPEVGRLEVFHNGTWGTVCDDQFTNIAAGVACYAAGHRWVLIRDFNPGAILNSGIRDCGISNPEIPGSRLHLDYRIYA